MKTLETLEQEAKQARDDMREVMLDEFGIGATLSDRILSLMIRAVQSNITHSDAIKEIINCVQGNSDSCDGWIEWKGGNCPVGYSTIVDVKTKIGDVFERYVADKLHWKHLGSEGDIIAYRIVK